MKHMKRLGVTAALAALVATGLLVSPASAVPSESAVVFNSIPQNLPGNVASWGFEATSTSEFGDYATFAGNRRDLQEVSVVMSSWGCTDGAWHTEDCVTTPADPTFSHPITLNLYNNPGDGTVGTEVASATKTFVIPYRPSADLDCTGGRWQADNGKCFNGLATVITFEFTGVTLPASVIYGISYNTTHYGDGPLGSQDCSIESGGCGYDALNVSADSKNPKVGTDDDVNGVFLNSSSAGSYCSGAAGTFRLDTPCWTGFNPMVRFTVQR